MSCQDGWGQSEEVDATASSANTLETPAGDTATPPRREFFTVPLQVPDHILDWLKLGHVVIPSHLELSFYNGRTANLPPTLLKWGIPQMQEGVSNAEQSKQRERRKTIYYSLRPMIWPLLPLQHHLTLSLSMFQLHVLPSNISPIGFSLWFECSLLHQ